MRKYTIGVDLDGVDLDGVCRDFLGALKKAFISHYPDYAHLVTEPLKYQFDHIPFEAAGVDSYDFLENIAAKEIMGLADPIEGAVEAANQIYRYAKARGHKVIVCSHQKQSMQHYSWLWLYINKIEIPNAVFVRDSAEKWTHADMLI